MAGQTDFTLPEADDGEPFKLIEAGPIEVTVPFGWAAVWKIRLAGSSLWFTRKKVIWTLDPIEAQSYDTYGDAEDEASVRLGLYRCVFVGTMTPKVLQ